jgi:hypothetical protein
MQTSGESPEGTQMNPQSRGNPIGTGYVPFEGQSYWMGCRPWFWAALILFFIAIGLAAVILPQFTLC